MCEVAVAEDLDHDTRVEVRQRPLLRHGDQVASDEAGEHRLVPQDVLRAKSRVSSRGLTGSDKWAEDAGIKGRAAPPGPIITSCEDNSSL